MKDDKKIELGFFTADGKIISNTKIPVKNVNPKEKIIANETEKGLEIKFVDDELDNKNLHM